MVLWLYFSLHSCSKDISIFNFFNLQGIHPLWPLTCHILYSVCSTANDFQHTEAFNTAFLPFIYPISFWVCVELSKQENFTASISTKLQAVQIFPLCFLPHTYSFYLHFSHGKTEKYVINYFISFCILLLVIPFLGWRLFSHCSCRSYSTAFIRGDEGPHNLTSPCWPRSRSVADTWVTNVPTSAPSVTEAS